MEGLRLIAAHRYLLGVFGIATFYEVIGTILARPPALRPAPCSPVPWGSPSEVLGRVGKLWHCFSFALWPGRC